MDQAMSRNGAAAAYNAAADCFDAPPLAFWDRFGRRTVERLGLSEGAHVLDVCCGSGASALVAAERVGATGQVLGLDIAESLLTLAREKARRLGLGNVRFEYGDLERLDAGRGSFDAVVCVFGIFFAADMAAVAARLWQLVRPEGVLAVTTWGPRLFEPADTVFWEAIRQEAPELNRGFHPWDRIAVPGDLQALFTEAGVGPVEVEAERGVQPLTTAADWWTIVLGSGFRGTVDRLSPEVHARVRSTTVGWLERNGVRAVETNVLYAVVRRPAA